MILADVLVAVEELTLGNVSRVHRRHGRSI